MVTQNDFVGDEYWRRTAVMAGKETAAGVIVGGLAGILLHAATRNHPTGVTVNGPKCALLYAVHIPGGFRTFRCPSCNQYLSLPDTAGSLQLKAAQAARSASLF